VDFFHADLMQLVDKQARQFQLALRRGSRLFPFIRLCVYFGVANQSFLQFVLQSSSSPFVHKFHLIKKWYGKLMESATLKEAEVSMNYVMTAETLQKKLQTERIAVIDVRSNLQNPDLGHDAYNEGHIPGAFFLHLEKDLSGEVKKHGGNHPLPDVGQLAAKFGAIGIDHRTTVVFYDDGNDMFAARAWWLLYYMGHEEAYVLDGGFNAWKEAGCEITKAVPKR